MIVLACKAKDRIAHIEVKAMLTAKDIMTKNVIYIKRDTQIYEALRSLTRHNISGIPVVEDDMTLVGIVSERDILRLFDTFENVEGKTVDDYMTQPAVFFEEQESISEISKCLANNYFRRVPVVSRGKLVGVVSRRDIIKNILQTKYQDVTAN
jgi:CBS domain-containing protein